VVAGIEHKGWQLFVASEWNINDIFAINQEPQLIFDKNAQSLSLKIPNL